MIIIKMLASILGIYLFCNTVHLARPQSASTHDLSNTILAVSFSENRYKKCISGNGSHYKTLSLLILLPLCSQPGSVLLTLATKKHPKAALVQCLLLVQKANLNQHSWTQDPFIIQVILPQSPSELIHHM